MGHQLVINPNSRASRGCVWTKRYVARSWELCIFSSYDKNKCTL